MITLTNRQRIKYHSILPDCIGTLVYNSAYRMYFGDGVRAVMDANGDCHYWFEDTKIETFILLRLQS